MWRRSASTAAARTSAEMRDVWRQLRQRSFIVNSGVSNVRGMHDAVICAENDRDARFVTAKCDARAASAARANLTIGICRRDRLWSEATKEETTRGVDCAG